MPFANERAATAELLADAIDYAKTQLRESNAASEAEQATIQLLRRRCDEAEERCRRAEWEVSELRHEAARMQSALPDAAATTVVLEVS